MLHTLIYLFIIKMVYPEFKQVIINQILSMPLR